MKDKSIPLFNKVVMIALLLSPVLQTYGWGKYNIATLLTFGLALVHFYNTKPKYSRIPKSLCAYLLFWYFSHVISNVFPLSIFPLGIIRIYLIYMMFYDCFNLEYFINKYRLFTLILILFFCVQTVSRLTMGKVIPGVFSFLPLAISDDTMGFFSSLQESERDCSLFSEPAIFVQFLFPMLALELLYYEKKSWFRISIIVLTLLFLQSGNALLGTSILGVFFIISYFKGRLSIKKVIGLAVVSFLIIFVGSTYIKSEMGEKLMDREETIAVGAYEEGYVGSGFIRIYRGYFIYKDYSLIDMIKGNDNVDHIKSVIKSSQWGWTFHNETYFNTFQSFLLYTGIIGTLIFGLFFVKQWRSTTYCGKSILACYLALSFIALMHFNTLMAIYMLIPFALKNGAPSLYRSRLFYLHNYFKKK